MAAQAACTGKAWLQAGGAEGTRGERTKNMPAMFVTLDVLKLSDWLNADACCQVKRRAYDAGRGAGREAAGRVLGPRRAQAARARGGPD